MKLLIVESPGKIKKLQSILPAEWRVAASVGHIRDLPQEGYGLEPPDFRPVYQITPEKKDVVARLRTLAQKRMKSIWPPTLTAKVRPLRGISRTCSACRPASA